MNQKRSAILVIPGPSLSHLSQILWFFSWILWILSLPHHQILDPYPVLLSLFLVCALYFLL